MQPLRWNIYSVGDFELSKIKCNPLVIASRLLNGHNNKVSEKVDVFSFEIVLWEILTGEKPYANMHYSAIIGGIWMTILSLTEVATNLVVQVTTACKPRLQRR